MYTLSGFFWFTTSACILLLDTRHGAQSSSRGTRAVCPSHSCVVVLVAVFSVEQKCEGSAEQPEYTVLTLKENVCLISPSKFTLVSTPTSMALFKCYLLRSVSKALHLVFIETATLPMICCLCNLDYIIRSATCKNGFGNTSSWFLVGAEVCGCMRQ